MTLRLLSSQRSELEKKLLTLYAELSCLSTLNEVLFTAFSVDFHNKRGCPQCTKSDYSLFLNIFFTLKWV